MMKPKGNHVKVIRKENEKFFENLHDEVKKNLCKEPKIRIKTIRENLDDETKEKLHESDQKRKQTICANLGDEVEEKLCKSNQNRKQAKVLKI